MEDEEWKKWPQEWNRRPEVKPSPRILYSSPAEEKKLGFPFSHNGPSAIQGEGATSPFSDLQKWEERGVTTPNMYLIWEFFSDSCYQLTGGSQHPNVCQIWIMYAKIWRVQSCTICRWLKTNTTESDWECAQWPMGIIHTLFKYVQHNFAYCK